MGGRENVLKGEGEQETCLILKWGLRSWWPAMPVSTRESLKLFPPQAEDQSVWYHGGDHLKLSRHRAAKHRGTVPCSFTGNFCPVSIVRTIIRKGTCLPDILFHLESVVYLPDILNLPTTAIYFSLSISGWNYLSTFPISSPPPLTCVMELKALSKGIGLRLPQASCVVISVFSGCKQCHSFQM